MVLEEAAPEEARLVGATTHEGTISNSSVLERSSPICQ